jgi:hypothetical protein
MSRNRKTSAIWLYRPESLEPRGLLTAGLASGLNTVMELGTVSRAAALKGVEVAATIPANGSITFEFQSGMAGNFLLEVRHVGEGLTLEATGPSGSASIDPGPTGPFTTIDLSLKAAGYAIKASAVGDQPVYVDWELLLSTGVGQSVAVGPALAASSTAVPLTSFTVMAASSASSVPSATPSIGSGDFGPAVTTALVASRGPVGRLEPLHAISPVGPATAKGGPALASAGDDLPIGALREPAVIAEEPVSNPKAPIPTISLALLGDARGDLEALEGLAKPEDADAVPDLSRVASSPAPAGGVGLAAETAFDEESKGSAAMAASPGLVATMVVLSSAASRWRNGPSCAGLRRA